MVTVRAAGPLTEVAPWVEDGPGDGGFAVAAAEPVHWSHAHTV